MIPLTFLHSHARRTAGIFGALLVAMTAPNPLAAQGIRSAACTPRPSAKGPTFVAGNEAGNLQQSSMKFWADGSVQLSGARRSAPDGAIADSVALLAAFARHSRFWSSIAPPITRPTGNPDMARHYVEARLRCGARRSLYPADAEPADFHALFTRLTALAKLATSP